MSASCDDDKMVGRRGARWSFVELRSVHIFLLCLPFLRSHPEATDEIATPNKEQENQFERVKDTKLFRH